MGSQYRFAIARNGNSASEFADAIVSAGVRLGAPATVLCDGDSGLWKLQRQVMPEATLVLDWFHITMRLNTPCRRRADWAAAHPVPVSAAIQSAIPTAPSGSFGTVEIACLWRLPHLSHWLDAAHVRDVRGADAVRRHVNDLIEYLHANRLALVNYGRRRHEGLPISTAFVESAVSEILSKRMIKKQQMRWNRWTVQPFLDVRVAVLNKTLCGSFKRHIEISKQTIRITPCGSQHDEPHDFAYSPRVPAPRRL
jgi:hypothetical protein